MKKTISITIAGVVFYIEEDGYDRLQGYLEAIKRYFATYDGSAEIIEDIEARVAEKFFDKLKKEDKQAVTAEDVDELIRAMGTVADFEAIEEEEDLAGRKTTTAGQASAPRPEPAAAAGTLPGQRKMYRDTRRKVLGGVCAGIAHYLNVDPLWIRLAALTLFIGSPIFGGMTDLGELFGPVSGFVFIIYIACWVSFPGNPNLEEDEKLKKLYRDPEKQALGGVAAGVAAYTGWDLGLIRFVWVLSVLFFGFGLILYFVLWAITPTAKTLTDRMKMQGEPITLTNIESNIKKTLNVENAPVESTATKVLLFPFRALAAIFEGLNPFFAFILVLIRILAGVALVVVGIGGIIGLMVLLGVGLGISQSEHMRFGDVPVGLLNDASPWMFVFAFIGMVVPSIAIGLAGISLLAKQNFFKPVVWQTLLGLFLVGAVGSAVMIPQYAANYSRRGTVERTSYLKPAGTPVFDLRATGDENFSHSRISLEGYDGADVKVVQEFSSRGKSRSEAEKQASQLGYHVTEKDSMLVFDSNFQIPDNVPFRSQEHRVKIYVPYEKTFSMTEEFAGFVTNRFPWALFEKDLFEGSLWKFTRDGELISINRELPEEEYGDDNNGDDHEYESRIGQGVAKDFKLNDFRQLEIAGGFAVEVKRGAEYRVTVYAESERKHEDIQVRVEGNTLKIGRKNKWFGGFRGGRQSVRIEMPDLEAAEFTGAVSAIVKGFEKVRGVEVSGASRATFMGLNADDVEVDVHGAATLTLMGVAKHVNADISGAAKLEAYSLKADDVEVDASGASHGNIFAKSRLNVSASGASHIRYKGEAKVEESTSGGSSVSREE
ncbi:GIN domain-containing protein [Siphonobacter aquaeclarae]|uniref:Phage shock protein C (PspC) family protein n=1 Tax=Siphonobacter aquaeclarae TaxID=563176 RepID=A0A1G9PQX3_9BACT|nr:DUF2807 domain-containing protein [Siphonobacter aquaeclarae]SDM01144.1 phage shock protein C (PspC) family protein [Siphonobacter aquaeclarae]